MKVQFQYDKEKDVWCLLNKGKSSNNSQNPTQQYEQLVASYGENPSIENIASFIENYLADKQINLRENVTKYQKDWDDISEEYTKRAERIFGVSLPKDIISYLTINSRCPYSIDDNYFFVTVSTKSANRTAMHELWHFYTWYGLGVDEEKRLGREKYNDIKEALTVLLNEECKDLLSVGVTDAGYPQHSQIRKQILELWEKEKDIKRLWKHFAQR